MGSSYFGEPNLGNERGGVGGSSRKGKKSSNSDKPKQPQRGLGVAQLEKIRLHGQMATCNYQYPNYPTTNLSHQEDMRIQQTGGYSSIPSSSSYSSSSVASSASYGFNPNIMMAMGDYDGTTNIRFGDSQPSAEASSWNTGHNIFEAQNYVHPNTTRPLLPLQVEQKSKKKQRSSSMGSSSQNSESSDAQELDLELRLSI